MIEQPDDVIVRITSGVDGFATHHLPLEEAPRAYADFQAKRDGMIKTLLQP